jgi:ADP-ribose pyrophosphatase YjhB (NUDIX family)/nicotinic acid mononucleotide adenylyltransferase
MVTYPKPSLTADAVVLCGRGETMSLLLIKRGREPYAGRWALPGGFLDEFEPPLTACLRELAEETGLELTPSQAVPLQLRGKQGRDPRGWTMTQPFLFWLPDSVPVKGADDAVDAFWVPLREIETLAFDHGAILCDALGKFWYDMPTFHRELLGIEVFGNPPHSSEDKIFFGGTFNPWHEGHGACVELCPSPDQLIVIPDANPFKDGPDDVCYWARYRYIQSKVADIGARVFPGFCGQETPNPTYGWLSRVRARRKRFLMGDDNLAGLSNWNEAERLVQTLDGIQVASRNADKKAIEAARAWLFDNNPNCVVEMLSDHPYRHLSSTRLREKRG